MRTVKWTGLLAVLLAVISLSASQSAIAPQPARAAATGLIPGLPGLPNPCDLIPDDTARKICKAAVDPIGSAGSAIGDIPGIPNPVQLVTNAINSGVNAIINQLASVEADAVGEALKGEANTLNTTTQVDLTADWFKQQYEIFLGAATILALAGAFFRGSSSALQKDPGQLVRTGQDLMLFLVLGGFLPGVVGLVTLYMDNKAAPEYMKTVGTSTNQLLNTLPDTISSSISSIGAAGSVGKLVVPLVFLTLSVIGYVLLILMFFFRLAMLYLVVASTIFAAALAQAGPQYRGLFRYNLSLLGVLVAFKLIAAIILSIGVAIFGSQQGAQPVVIGAIIILTLPLSLWAVYKRVHNIQFVPLNILNNQMRRAATSFTS